MRKKYRLIIVLLLFIFSFNAFTVRYEKKADASALAILLGAGASMGAFVGMAQLFAVNGWHMQISDAATYFMNTFYDKAEENYIAKEGKISTLEKLGYYTSSILSGNPVMDMTELAAAIRENSPPEAEVTYLPGADAIITPQTLPLSSLSNASFNYTSISSYTRIDGASKYTWVYNDGLPGSVRYQPITYDGRVFGWVKVELGAPRKSWNTNGLYLSVITVNNELISVVGDTLTIYNGGYVDGVYTAIINSISYLLNSNDPYDPKDYGVTLAPDTPATDPAIPMRSTGFNFLDLLAGQGKTIDEIMTAMDTNADLQAAIMDRLNDLDREKEYPVVAPGIDPITGGMVYDQDIPVTSDSDKLWSIGKTLTNIRDWLQSLPGMISAPISGLWENISVPLLGIRDYVSALPETLSGLWDTTFDVPMESLDFSRLKFDGFTTRFPFSIPFDFIRVFSLLRADPISPDLDININTKYLKVNHTIDIKPFELYISFFRWFVLLTFVIGLMFVTKNLIKW